MPLSVNADPACLIAPGNGLMIQTPDESHLLNGAPITVARVEDDDDDEVEYNVEENGDEDDDLEYDDDEILDDEILDDDDEVLDDDDEVLDDDFKQDDAEED